MLEQLVPLVPVHFFQVSVDCFQGQRLTSKHLLPDLAKLNGSRSFAQVALGWSEKGISAEVTIKGAFDTPDFPNFQNADSIEFFFDTRDVKTSGFNTRFCHHFYFLPQPFETNGERVQAGEATRFRTEDAHELCDSTKLEIRKKKKGEFEIFIPEECLHGYDPTQFKRLGFTYRINRIGQAGQLFAANDEDFKIEQQPSLWASLELKK